MTVMSLPNDPMQSSMSGSGTLTPIATRQCQTLPRRMSGPGKLPAPAPPRRDPRTTLSVGRARAKSMVAGLENGGEKDDDVTTPTNPPKSTSIESLNQMHHIHSSMSTPTTHGPGTPTQPRTASIKARPTSSRITAAELEQLFSRQHGSNGAADNSNRFSTMLSSSRFQSGLESGAATPPASPHKGPLVYASVADMKRKNKAKVSGTLKGRPVPIPTVQSELKRSFHSTPDLATALSGSVNSVTWASTFKNHRSQDDMHNLHKSLSRLNLPPPEQPPPPPPLGQVVKVDVSRGSDYDSTVTLQQQLAQRAQQKQQEGEVMSSFKPESNAKLYASPQELNMVAIRKNEDTGTLRPVKVATNGNASAGSNTSPYAQPGRPGISQNVVDNLPAPPIPDPDYSLSESDGEEDSVRHVRIVQTPATTTVEVNGTTNTNNNNAGQAAETSGSSNTSGSSTGSGSMVQSFSVDEIAKIRSKLKTSKSYPNDFMRQQSQNRINENNEEGDNSSSGVSSDQEIQANNNGTPELKKQPQTSPPQAQIKTNVVTIPIKGNTPQSIMKNNVNNGGIAANKNYSAPPPNPKPMPVVSSNPNHSLAHKIAQLEPKKTSTISSSTPVTTKVTTSIVAKMMPQQVAPALSQIKANKSEIGKLPLQPQLSNEQRSDDDDNQSPSPPSLGFQRHNSLTRKQAAQLAAQRAKAMQSSARAVSLAQLPPPIEVDSDDPDANSRTAPLSGDQIVLAPPPEFCDFVSNPNQRVRIIGTIPKTNRLHSQ